MTHEDRESVEDGNIFDNMRRLREGYPSTSPETPTPEQPAYEEQQAPRERHLEKYADSRTPEASEANPEDDALDAETTRYREALQRLISSGVIYESRHSELYQALLANKSQIRSTLRELGLRMTVDDSFGLIILRLPVSDDIEEDEGAHPLVRRRRLTLLDSLVALVLRDHYMTRENVGDRTVVIDVEQLEDALRAFLPIFGSETILRKRITGAIKRFKDYNILASLPGSDNEFEVTPVIRIVVNADMLQGLRAEFEALARRYGGEAPDNHEVGDNG